MCDEGSTEAGCQAASMDDTTMNAMDIVSSSLIYVCHWGHWGHWGHPYVIGVTQEMNAMDIVSSSLICMSLGSLGSLGSPICHLGHPRNECHGHCE